MSKINDRTYLLIEDKIKLLEKAKIAVVGIGGVGGIAAESLVRSGVIELVLIDYDRFELSNLNRQILATRDDLNEEKVEVAKKRFLKINNLAKITTISQKINQENIEILNNYQLDFIIDCIDSIYSKWALIKYCLSKNIKFISVMGMGNRLDASKIEVTTLDKTTDDQIAKKLRQLAKKERINPKKITVVCSREIPRKPSVNDDLQLDKKTPASMIFVPNGAGLIAAGVAVKTIIED